MLQRLQMLQAQGKLGTAEANFRRILATAPDHLHARLGLGCCAWLAGDNAEADAIFAAIVASPLASEDAQIDCAQVLRATGHLEHARSLLRPYRTASARVAMILAELDEQSGDLAAACDGYHQALARDAGSEPATRKYALLLQRLGDIDAALAAVDAWAAQDSGHAATAWHMRSQLLRAEGNATSAVGALRESIALHPAASGWRVELASELRRAGQFAEAEDILTAVPPSHDLLLALGDLALARRDHDQALGLALSAQEAAPQRPEALTLQYRIALDRRDYTAAFAASDKIEALGAEHHMTALRRRVDIHRAMGQQADALKLLQALQSRQPRDPQWALEIARQHRRMGSRDGAEAQLQMALAKDPDQPALVAEACDFATQLEDYETALAFAQHLSDLQPDRVSHHVRISRLLRSLGRDEEAEAIWTMTQTRFAQRPEVRDERLRQLRGAGAVDDAYRQARANLSDWPGSMRHWQDFFDLAVRRDAIDDVERLLAQAPVQSGGDEVTLLRAKSRFAQRRKQYAEARDLLHTALALSPSDRSVLAELFSLAMRRGSVADAQHYHTQLAELQKPAQIFGQKSIGQFQTFHGQMLNDLLLDRAAMAELETVRSLPAKGRIEKLLPIMQGQPDHIPTAAMIAVTLSEGGYFQPAAGEHADVKIPMKITQYWDTAAVPDDVLSLSESWRICNTDWEYRRFNNESALLYLQAHFPPQVRIAFQRAEDATTKADILRLAVLLRDGGVWADMDDRCLQPLASFFRPGIEALFWQEPSGHIGNNFIASRARHPVLGRALVLAINALNRGDRDKVWMLTGPGLLTRAFALVLAERGDAWQEWLATLQVVDEFELWQQVAYHCQLSYKVQGRHWSKLAFRGAFGNRASFRKKGPAAELEA
jgi:tetratricopeptide (TPR) repeat protein